MATRRALIVEDNREIAALVKLHLRDIQCEADIAADGKRGLELASGRRYDIVVLDLMLPEMDGLALCREIRTLPGYVPILMLTAKSTSSTACSDWRWGPTTTSPNHSACASSRPA